ncbi:MAG: type II secretion system GspH family protein [Gemmatimonadales bacterium]|nr:type II secretion system GspH family protein [Gemmatimonadales bacterium]
MRNERGMTLIEMLLAMTVFLIVLGGAMSAIGAQSRGFSKGTEEMGMLQNLRYGVQQMRLEFRTAGANVADRQPAVVYASGDVFSFNADLVSNLPGDISAVYVDQGAPAGQVSALPLAQAAAVPGSSPAFTYPQVDFAGSPAETITFRFQPDAATARTDDFLLTRQVNGQPTEVLVRNALRPAGNGPFFSYSYYSNPTPATQTLQPVPAGWLPLRHAAPQHGQLPDTGTVARIDLLRTVTVGYQVTNGLTGAAERIRAVATTIGLPNVGVKKLLSCGDSPILGVGVLATPTTVAGQPRIELSWGAAVDETAGETDVIRYVVWRRVGGAVAWGDPITSVPTGGAPYLYTDVDVVTGETYQYAVAAQDCTPALSPLAQAGPVVAP